MKPARKRSSGGTGGYRPGHAPKRSCDLDVYLGDKETDQRPSCVMFDAELNHTIKWDDEMTCALSRLPRWLTEWPTIMLDPELQRTGVARMKAGMCVLGTFPQIQLPNGESRLATPNELCVMTAIILDLTCMRLPDEGAEGLRDDKERNPEGEARENIRFVMDVVDITGSRPIHALQLASRRPAGSAAHQLVYTMFTMQPRLMVHAHLGRVPETGTPNEEKDMGGQLFTGENCMHIAAVNQQERLLCAMIKLSAQLNQSERKRLFSSKTTGAFFQRKEHGPQVFYGGTVLAFAAVHCLKKAVKLLAVAQRHYTGGLNLGHGDENKCAVTGFFPIHAVVACGKSNQQDRSIEMVRFLTEEQVGSGCESLAFGQFADPTVCTVAPSVPHAPACVQGLMGLSPLQLSVKLGNTDMFRHLLRWHHTTVAWEWGERRCYSIQLKEIDEVKKNNDVLNLCCREESEMREERLHMLSDEFMEGFIWDLFEQKWNKYAYEVHLIFLSILITKLAMLVYMVFSVKQSIGGELTSEDVWIYKGISIILLVLLGLHMSFEISSILFLVQNRTDLDVWEKRRECFRQAARNYWTFSAAFFNTVAIIILLTVVDTTHPTPDHELQGIGVGPYHSSIGESSVSVQLLCFFLSMAMLCQAVEVNEAVWSINEETGFFFQTVVNMLKQDIIKFLPVFVTYVLIFWASMYALYPSEGVQNVKQFNSNSPITTLSSMFMLALTGETFEIELYDDFNQPTWNVSPMIAFNFWTFYLLYLTFIFITVILLLNLLIARMNSTYTKIEDRSRTEWRAMHARRVIRLENTPFTSLLTSCCGRRVNAGDPQPMRDASTCYTYQKKVAIEKLPDGRRVDPNFFNIPDPRGLDEEEMQAEALAADSKGGTPMPTWSKVLNNALLASSKLESSTASKLKDTSRMPPNLFATLSPGDWVDGESTNVWEDKPLDEYFPANFATAHGWAKANGSHADATYDTSSMPSLLATLRDPRPAPQSPYVRSDERPLEPPIAQLEEPVEAKAMPSSPQHEPVTDAHRRPPSISTRSIIPAPALPALGPSSAHATTRKPLPPSKVQPSLAPLGSIQTRRQPPELPSQDERAPPVPQSQSLAVAPPVDSVYVGGRPHVLRQGQRSELVLVPAPRGMFPPAAAPQP